MHRFNGVSDSRGSGGSLPVGIGSTVLLCILRWRTEFSLMLLYFLLPDWPAHELSWAKQKAYYSICIVVPELHRFQAKYNSN